MKKLKKLKKSGDKTSYESSTQDIERANDLLDIITTAAFICKGIRPAICVHETVDILYEALMEGYMDINNAVAIGRLIRTTKVSSTPLQ